MTSSTLASKANATILEQFDDVCRQAPNSIAIIDDCGELSYSELSDRASRIANCLVRRNVQGGQCVGVCMDRSANAIAVMIGIMRSGAAFVPLDPEYPVERLRYMTSDATISTIFCDDRYRDRFHCSLALVAPDQVTLDDSLTEPVSVTVNPDDLAYIMYTSGSTGNPKGVEIQHLALATYCDADADIYQLTSADRTLQFSTLNFDIAIEEIFPPLLTGGIVVVRPIERSVESNELSAIIDRHQVTALHLATAYWHEWIDLMIASRQTVPTSLRMVLATGEKVSPQHYQRWLTLCQHEVLWCNAYGPTETTVTATVFVPPKDWNGQSMPIGKPLKGYSAYILDAHDRPLADGETGDLYIGGPALARGYLNLPEKTAAVFRTISLPNSDGGEETLRLYKTGDLARWLPSGDIEYAGRIDHQIKLGSYRIEPAEIEFQLAAHPQVTEALVTFSEVDGKKALVAYLATPPQAVTATEVAAFLRDRLPAYMIPHRYCFIEGFPKTINGKIDRPKLPNPSSGQVPSKEQYAEPRNELERMLVELWQTVLGIEKIGINDDFFAAGGSSLLVTRVIAGICSRYELAIPVRDFFANPTIASIARLLAERLHLDQAETDSSALSQKLRDSLPAIDAFYFPVRQANLFGVRYIPPSDVRTGKRHGVMICNADGHEYTRSHRNVQQLAVRLAQLGLDVLRFDYSCCGNSSGDNKHGLVEDWQQEMIFAAELHRRRAGLDELSVVGIRTGATLAAGAGFTGLKHLVLWDPVASGAQYMEMLDAFQHRSMNHVTDYLRPRKPTIPQTFGIELPDQKREGFERLCFPPSPRQGCAVKTTIVASKGYLQAEGLDIAVDQWQVVEMQDEILWHDHQYTTSAFSAPETADMICCLLSEA